ncbi:hypothetical protein [Jiangella asiatica]|uniref:Uncharacterized protein n=1 Tax=Jiangella asiatica TaxID=2530372 RepID=A0A4R5DFT9_9ACTN|nr:hypothetical protein [Jiangella asiatica]TDE10654.1 hypothetical protein E1269_11310 [Jiangella asiatica]
MTRTRKSEPRWWEVDPDGKAWFRRPPWGRGWYGQPADDDPSAKTFEPRDVVHINDPAAGVTYQLDVEVVDGVPRIRGLALTVAPGRYIDAAALRRIPVASLAQYAADSLAGAGTSLANPDDQKPSVDTVAEAAWQAYRAGRPQRHAVAEVFGISVRTADWWLTRARSTEGVSMPPKRKPGRPRKGQDR